MSIPGPMLCFQRQLLLVFDLAFFGIGLLRPLWNARRRCFSDSFTATFVAAVDPEFVPVRFLVGGQIERLR
jgi:hypothetical protein